MGLPPHFDLDGQAALARKFLRQKVRETIGKCGVPGLGAVLVRDAGDRVIDAVHGVRKLGASGVENAIQPHDKWFLGSISKPVTGTVIGILIQKGIGGITWKTTLRDVFPEITSVPGGRSEYFDVSVEQFMAHTSGMPIAPAQPGDELPSDVSQALSDANVMQRRRRYVNGAVLDAPKFTPGQGVEYSGGTIICAAMFEAKTGVRFDRLLKQHLYDPLGMAHSGWGRTSVGPLDGLWLHAWNEQTLALEAFDGAHVPESDFGSRSVAGNFTMSAGDMGRFLRENLRPDPQTMSAASRAAVHSQMVTAASGFSRGGWAVASPASAASSVISHNGDGGSMYADLALHRAQGWGSAAFVHCNNLCGAPAVHDLQDCMAVMMERWSEMFAAMDTPMWESVHPTPAVVFAAGNALWVFARRSTGALVRLRVSLDGTSNGPEEFPGGVFTSGVAAASNGSRIVVVARGTDDRIWRGWSHDGGTSWKGFVPIDGGTFDSGPAVAMSGDGQRIHVVATGKDARMYHARSADGGSTWSDWHAIGAGVFTSQPAITCRNDGNVVSVFGRGTDHRIWHNGSSDGDGWGPHWRPIGQGIFTSGPAAACGSSGGALHVVARGTDRAYWRNSSSGGSEWQPHWQQVPNGVFATAPALEATLESQTLDLVGLGLDWRLYRSRSANAGASWGPWKKLAGVSFI